MIPQEIYDKYGLNVNGDEDLEETPKLTRLILMNCFLKKTDHIPNKIIESEFLGNETTNYTDILLYRQYARDQINILVKE